MNQYILVNEGKSVTMHSDDLPLVLIQQTCWNSCVCETRWNYNLCS
jgi:hypothetical protein